VRTGAEDAGEVEQHEGDDDDNDDYGHHQAAVPALGLRIVVVSGKAWHLGSSWLQPTSRRVVVSDPAHVAAAA
jgi:hypothetical protein